MADGTMQLAELAQSLPPEWPEDVRPDLRRRLAASPQTLVVLDDDPTGTQTVHGVPVLTGWSAAALRAELEHDLAAFYILTNSRSLPPAEAEALSAEIGRNLRLAAEQTGRPVGVVSRSDSTLRGHFPGEVSALAQALGQAFDAWLLIPYFEEGGRLTAGDVHYVLQAGQLTPVGDTEFARDSAFGFRASNLRAWVEEKTQGRVPASQVASVTLAEIRLGGPQAVAGRLMELPPGSICVVNAASPRDLEVFTAGLLAAEAQGRRFLYRTAASFVPVRAGLALRPLLTPAEVIGDRPAPAGGLIVAGSYVPRTTSQLDALLAAARTEPIEVEVPALLAGDRRLAEIERAAARAEAALRRGQDAVIYTSRSLITGPAASDSLAIGRTVSGSLVEIVRAIGVRPRYVIAKGGITSSDVATLGLGVRRAMVLGQILPGVPVWQLGPESRHPGLRYIVFPGNVGEARALADLVDALAR